MARAWRRGNMCRCGLEKRRLVVILTRDALSLYLRNVTVAPLTTRVRSTASQVVLELFGGLPERAAISLDNLQAIPKGKLGELMTSLSSFRMNEVQQAAIFALELDIFG